MSKFEEMRLLMNEGKAGDVLCLTEDGLGMKFRPLTEEERKVQEMIQERLRGDKPIGVNFDE